MRWDSCQLGDVLKVKHGFAFKSQFFEDQGPHVVMTPGNFFEAGGFRARPGKDRSYSGDIPSGYILQAGDVVVAMTEQGPGLLGSSAIIPEDGKFLHNQRIGLIHEVDEKRAAKEFLYHLFNTREVRAQINGSATGTKVRHTAPDRIYRVNVDLPPVQEQRRIASILKNYDDLIENNRRRIALLEEAARLLYREWFVHFRFPGHEHVKIVDDIPEAWNHEDLFDHADPLYGYAFKSKQFTEDDEGIPVVRIRDIPEGVSKTYTLEEAPEEKLLSDGDFLVGMDGIFHQNYWTGGKAWLNQRVVRLSSKGSVSTGFIREAVRKPIEDFNKSIAGTTVAHLGAKHLKMITIPIPPAHLLDVANEIFELHRLQIVNLSKQNRQLTSARDLLLPRLMDGRLEVAA